VIESLEFEESNLFSVRIPKILHSTTSQKIPSKAVRVRVRALTTSCQKYWQCSKHNE
jgi:hypothetical protein